MNPSDSGMITPFHLTNAEAIGHAAIVFSREMPIANTWGAEIIHAHAHSLDFTPNAALVEGWSHGGAIFFCYSRQGRVPGVTSVRGVSAEHIINTRDIR